MNNKYLQFISVTEAKQYLRVDLSYAADNTIIENMILAACGYIESQTQIYLYARDFSYLFSEGIARVYSYPINTTELPEGVTMEEKSLYRNYCAPRFVGAANEKITLNVGYEDPGDADAELKQCALELIQEFYNSREKGVSPTIPITCQILIADKRRFIL